MINYNKHVWEGWTVRMIVDDLEWMFIEIMENRSHSKRFKSREEVSKWCTSNQRGPKKYNKDVVDHFDNLRKDYEIEL